MAPAPTTEAPLSLPRRPLTRLPRAKLPAGTIDCHFHVFREGAPFAPTRNYTPPISTLADWRALAGAVGISHGVIVQPSVYGFDNSVMLEALAADPEHLRGIAVLPADTGAAELKRLHGQGIRGVRCNTRNPGGVGIEAIAGLLDRIGPLGWSVQLLMRPDQIPGVARLAPSLGLPIVVDHLCFVSLDAATRQQAIEAFLALLGVGDCYLKLSAPYRLSRTPGYEGFGDIAAALIAAHPNRLLWGTDWPHTELWDNVPDDADLVDLAWDWFGNDATRRMIFVETPQRLFFGDK